MKLLPELRAATRWPACKSMTSVSLGRAERLSIFTAELPSPWACYNHCAECGALALRSSMVSTRESEFLGFMSDGGQSYRFRGASGGTPA